MRKSHCQKASTIHAAAAGQGQADGDVADGGPLHVEGVRDGPESGWASQPVPELPPSTADMFNATWPPHGAGTALVGPLAAPLNQPDGKEALEYKGR